MLDARLMDWRNSVPREWEIFSFIRPEERSQRSKAPRSACAPSWLDYASSYPDLSKARWMNHFRCQSIINQSITLHCAERIDRYHTTECSALEEPTREDFATAHNSSTTLKALNSIRTLVDGICASVPYHLDKSPLKGHYSAISPVMSSERSTPTRPGDTAPAISPETPIVAPDLKPPAGAIAIGHPLLVAYRAPGIPADQREWILNKMLTISKHFGVDGVMVEKKLKSSVSF